METLKVTFRYPYAEATDRMRERAFSREDYDPASLFRWGTMMGVAVLRMLEAAERSFGKEGQKAMIGALVEVGREIGRQALVGVDVPAGTEPIELVSAYASWINREIYASPEAPRIDDEDRCSFDILWCPHQDTYGPFDCRVQRYLVQGMIEAARERFPAAGFDVRVLQTIPAGGEVCTFEVWRKPPGVEDEWEARSEKLAGRALSSSRPGT